MNNTLQIAKNFTVQFDGYFIGPTVRTQGRQEGFFYADLGIRQQFLKGKLTAGFSFLNTAKYKSYINTSNLNSNTTIWPKYPLLTVSLGYTFNNFKQCPQGLSGSDFFEGTNY